MACFWFQTLCAEYQEAMESSCLPRQLKQLHDSDLSMLVTKMIPELISVTYKSIFYTMRWDNMILVNLTICESVHVFLSLGLQKACFQVALDFFFL